MNHKKLARLGFVSALEAHDADGMPPAAVVWDFLQNNPEYDIPALVPMSVEFENEYNRLVEAYA